MAKNFKRHTIRVEDVKKEANRLMARQHESLTPEFRQGVEALLTFVLHETGQYRGFNYVEWMEEGGCERWKEDGEPRDNTPYLGDQTRKRFY